MNGPLSTKQIRVLVCLAREAFAVAKPGIPFDDWRRHQVAEATGNRATGLSTALNNDYNAIKAHFFALKGATGKAFETRLREQTDFIRQLRHELATLLCEHGLTPAYANRIALDRYGIANVMDCDEEQTRKVLMTVKARVTKKDAEQGKTSHRQGIAPARRDQRKKSDPLDPTKRLPALHPSHASHSSQEDPERINADLQLNAQPERTDSYV